MHEDPTIDVGLNLRSRRAATAAEKRLPFEYQFVLLATLHSTIFGSHPILTQSQGEGRVRGGGGWEGLGPVRIGLPAASTFTLPRR